MQSCVSRNAKRAALRLANATTSGRKKPTKASDTFKADVAIRLQDVLAIQQLHVIQAWNGKTFVGMPQKNSAKGEREDIAHAVNAEFKADLESAIMDEYNKKMEYAKSQKQQRRGR